MKKAFVLLLLPLLAACGATPEASASGEVVTSSDLPTSEASLSESVPSSVSSVVSEEESSAQGTVSETSVSMEESEAETTSEESLPASSLSSEPEVPGQGAWMLTDDALPGNPAQGALYDVDFSVRNGKGQSVDFRGTHLRHGEGTKGDVALTGTIQMSKEDSYLYMTSGYATYLVITIAYIHQFYGGQDHDFTGVPILYSADEMTAENGEEVALERVDDLENNRITYSALLPHQRFRLENNSSYAMYVYSINNLA